MSQLERIQNAIERAGLGALLLMDLPEMLYGVAVSQMAMPVAVTGTLMCATYGGDQRSMAQVTFLTTVMSIVTIPILAVTLM